MTSSDEAFRDGVVAALAAVPKVEAVALGGSRALGTAEPGSDWDFAVYYRDQFDPADVRALGWPGYVSELGEWGGGVFNGGAWLEVDGQQVDVHYRDLTDVEHRIAEAAAGRFDVESLMFHLAGIPTYLVVAELALNQVLSGELPRPEYPSALRRTAPELWWGNAKLTLAYARSGHAERGHVTECLGQVAVAVTQVAHAVLAARGEWVTNEKRMIDRTGLRAVDDLVAGARPDGLVTLLDDVTALLTSAVTDAYGGEPGAEAPA